MFPGIYAPPCAAAALIGPHRPNNAKPDKHPVFEILSCDPVVTIATETAGK